MRPAPRVTVVVVTYDRPVAIAACLKSLARQPQPDLEIIVVLNAATSKVVRVTEAAISTDRRVRSLACERRSASAARNLAAAEARGDLLYFIDDDIELPDGAIQRLIDLTAQRAEAAVLGGPNLTPPDDPPFAQMAGALLASIWGSGPTRYRYAARPPRPATERDLILCNLVVKREVFEQGIRFPDAYFGGEENILMGYVEHAGGVLGYEPDLWVYHRRRPTWGGHAKQMVRYGRGRAVAALWAPRTRHLAFLAPALLLVYAAAAPVLAWHDNIIGWWLPGAIYLTGTLVASVVVAAQHRSPSWVFGLLALYPLTHLAYALGLVGTLLRRPNPWRSRRRGRDES